MARPPIIDPLLRSSFREIARNIVGQDRDARRSGRSQNTIGTIESALVNAYQLGAHSKSKTSPQQTVPSPAKLSWELIPPRARDTLQSMSFWFSARYGSQLDQQVEIERFIEDGRVRWATRREGHRDTHSVADGSVAPLIRLGLIVPTDEHKTTYKLSDSGIDVCVKFWSRSDANDPSLPRESMR